MEGGQVLFDGVVEYLNAGTSLDALGIGSQRARVGRMGACAISCLCARVGCTGACAVGCLCARVGRWCACRAHLDG